jgi:hypothetical protein
LDKTQEQIHTADKALRREISFMKPSALRQIRPSHVNMGRPNAYDEAVIRDYIRNQEAEDERLDQLNQWK